jgi:hypothetical protein
MRWVQKDNESGVDCEKNRNYGKSGTGGPITGLEIKKNSAIHRGVERKGRIIALLLLP